MEKKNRKLHHFGFKNVLINISFTLQTLSLNFYEGIYLPTLKLFRMRQIQYNAIIKIINTFLSIHHINKISDFSRS